MSNTNLNTVNVAPVEKYLHPLLDQTILNTDGTPAAVYSKYTPDGNFIENRGHGEKTVASFCLETGEAAAHAANNGIEPDNFRILTLKFLNFTGKEVTIWSTDGLATVIAPQPTKRQELPQRGMLQINGMLFPIHAARHGQCEIAEIPKVNGDNGTYEGNDLYLVDTAYRLCHPHNMRLLSIGNVGDKDHPTTFVQNQQMHA